MAAGGGERVGVVGDRHAGLVVRAQAAGKRRRRWRPLLMLPLVAPRGRGDGRRPPAAGRQRRAGDRGLAAFVKDGMHGGEGRLVGSCMRGRERSI